MLAAYGHYKAVSSGAHDQNNRNSLLGYSLDTPSLGLTAIGFLAPDHLHDVAGQVKDHITQRNTGKLLMPGQFADSNTLLAVLSTIVLVETADLVQGDAIFPAVAAMPPCLTRRFASQPRANSQICPSPRFNTVS
ncbi:Sec23 Sec24 family [Cordyceps militaris]|uniref:Sec23 Sec24 family n=1 Tax=Cordyceps militaris TaxID=73501 RepID=A0A2H4SPQ6_CORMI|nr:Sec23 Sec24 family [Cordyceps militaris]